MDFNKIKAFVFDVDGALTDGRLLGMPDGDFLRQYDAKDGMGMRMPAMNGYIVAIITGGSSMSIVKRFKASGLREEDIYIHSRDKVEDLYKLCDAHGISPEEILYLGDDIPDIPVLRLVGIPACPIDAAAEVREVCSFISSRPGGKGAARDVIETVMRAQGKWSFDVSEYKKRF